MRAVNDQKRQSKSPIEPVPNLEKTHIERAIVELDRKILRFKSACLSTFSRPIDRENLRNAQSELLSLRLQKSST